MRTRTTIPALALICAAAACGTARTEVRPDAASGPGLRVRASALAARSDSLEVRAGGRAVGWQSARLTPAAGGFRYEETTSLGPTRQRTVVELDAAGVPRSVEQRGTAAGKEMRIDLQYRGRSVSGQAMTPLSNGVSVAIDTLLPAGTIDDNALQAVLPALAWAPDAAWTFPVFSSGKGTVAQHTLRVTGVESAGAPGAEVESYRAELTGGENSVIFWVSVQQPHRVMKVAVPGTPIEFFRVR